MELKKDFPDVKIIAISGGGRMEPDSYLQLAKQVGAIRTFLKLIDRKELLKAVRKLLKWILTLTYSPSLQPSPIKGEGVTFVFSTSYD